jgi:hypothetical protein
VGDGELEKLGMRDDARRSAGGATLTRLERLEAIAAER